MADINFIDPDNGMPYPTTGPNTQEAEKTILNYHPVILDFILDPSENRLEGEIWIENAQVANFDTNNNPPIEFLQSGDARNNHVFIQPYDQIEAEILKIDGSGISPTQSFYLQTKRQGASQLSVLNEVSFGRFIDKTDRSEFSEPGSGYDLSPFDFIFKVDDLINLDLTEFNVSAGSYGSYGTAYTPYGFGYTGTDKQDSDLSLARRVEDVKDWLNF